MPRVPQAVRIFAPELWGSLNYFQKFYEVNFNFSQRQKRAVSGVSGHFSKAQYLIALAEKLRPNLEIDAAELETHGYSAVHNSHELGTVVEAAMLELYSVIDCTVTVIHAVHGKTTRGLKESTSGFFKNIDTIKGSLPNEIQHSARNAQWYGRLLLIRSEITHLTPGSCHQDHESKAVKYVHPNVINGNKALVIDDVFVWLDELLHSINSFIGTVFHYLSKDFSDHPVHQICGMVEGRMLHRYLRPVQHPEKITFDSGECGAWVWFEKPEFPTCPFTEHCGAYRRKAPPQGWETD